MDYDPLDAELENKPEEDEPFPEPGRLNKGACYDLSKLRLRGWWTPLGFRPSMTGYYVAEYFEDREGAGMIGRYLGADSFGVEPLFELE